METLKHKTAAYHTLGCKLNFAETSTIARELTDAGYNRVEFDQSADVYVINTCSVTENADKECKYHVKRAMKANPEGLVVVVGCYAQLKPEEIANIDGVDLVLGAKEKFNVLIPESEHYHSLGGFIFHHLKRHPKAKETITIKSFKIKILAATNTRIKTVALTKLE